VLISRISVKYFWVGILKIGAEGKVTLNSASLASVPESYDSRFEAQRKLVEELKEEWKLLWSERFDDKVRAEGVSADDYASIRVERGTIIHATRDFKALSFREILEQRLLENPERYIQPDGQAGGWSKFVKTEITARRLQKGEHARFYAPEKSPSKRGVQQAKKGGKGWLHTI
jgi:hypothetical protein